MAKKETQWFVKPLNDHTNEMIAREINEENFGEQRTLDGKTHKMWQVPHEFIVRLRGADSSFDTRVKFKVFSRKGNEGNVRENNITAPRKGRTKKQKIAEKRLKDLGA